MFLVCVKRVAAWVTLPDRLTWRIDSFLRSRYVMMGEHFWSRPVFCRSWKCQHKIYIYVYTFNNTLIIGCRCASVYAWVCWYMYRCTMNWNHSLIGMSVLEHFTWSVVLGSPHNSFTALFWAYIKCALSRTLARLRCFHLTDMSPLRATSCAVLLVLLI